MIEIREATADDREPAIDMSEHAFGVSGLEGTTAFDREGAGSFFDASVEDPVKGILVVETRGKTIGLGIASLIPTFYSSEDFFSQVLLFWIDPEFRGTGAGKMLLTALEGWSANQGATSIIGTALKTNDNKGAANRYEEAGYRELEQSYSKELT